MSIFGSAVIWNGIVRFVLFWLLVALGLVALADVTPYANWGLVYAELREVGSGNISGIAEKHFAFALSSGIIQVALALAFALFVAHVLLLRAALYAAKRELGRTQDLQEFAAKFDTISERLRRNAVVGHAWHQFAGTAVRGDDAVRNTVRPQFFINLTDARERLFGLKMMGSIPGFFVGLGLLLTFIGLVFALNSAAGSTGAGSAEKMTESLNQLLAAATFKFSTSIAGLGASLVLSLLFRTYQILIESGFDSFGRAIEKRMIFHPPQRIAAESLDVLAAQRDELKEINSDRFFTRLGDSVGPALQSAVTDAVRPISDRLDRTVHELTRTSQTGTDELVRTFIASLNQGAGRELTEVAGTFAGLKDALEGVQRALAGSGQDFSTKLADAAEAISRVATDAGRILGGSASGVAEAVDAAMARVVERLDAQTAAFGSGITTLQASVAAQLQESVRQMREAGEVAAETSRRTTHEATIASSTAAGEALQKVRDGMNEVVTNLHEDIGRLSETLRSVATVFSNQTQQIESVSARSRDTADAFGRIATDVRSASQPLLTQSERVANSTDRMAASIASSVGALSTTQEAAAAIAQQLSAHLDQIGRVWEQYESRFKGVDEDFGKAADRFHEEVSRHQEAMRDFVTDIDAHTKDILGKVSSAVAALTESIETLNETFDEKLGSLTRTTAPHQAAE